MSSTNFQGWLGKDSDSVKGNMVWGDFEPKVWKEDDVDIEISHCGICGSDLHTLKSGWGETPYPCVVGHEIVGKAVRVGSNVKHVKVGDRVGVGAQARSCLESDCPDCSAGHENHCARGNVGTYGSVYPNDEGKSYGGYATHNRTNGHFVIPIPEGVDSAVAAPLLCGGITIFSPLKRYGCGPGKTVGIVGVGGIGHFGVLFAKALGADKVIAISRKSEKADDAKKLGADKYIATDDDKDWAKENARSIDLIIGTVSSEKMPLEGYLSLLKTYGTYIQIGAPDGGKLPPINAFTLLSSGIKVGGSAIGSPGEIKEMLELTAEKKIKPWIQERPMKEANQAVIDMEAGKARYRQPEVVSMMGGKHRDDVVSRLMMGIEQRVAFLGNGLLAITNPRFQANCNTRISGTGSIGAGINKTCLAAVDERFLMHMSSEGWEVSKYSVPIEEVRIAKKCLLTGVTEHS